MPDFVMKVNFLTKDGLQVEGFASEMLSPFCFKVYLPGDTTIGRYPSIHVVSWCDTNAHWVAQ